MKLTIMREIIMKIKGILIGLLMCFFLVPSTVLADEEELEVKELSSEYTELSDPIEWDERYFLSEGNKVIIIKKELIVDQNNLYYFGRDYRKKNGQWQAIDRNFISYNNGEVVTIYDVSGNIVDSYEITEDERITLSYNPERKSFVLLKENLSKNGMLGYRGNCVDNICFFVSNTFDSQYALLHGDGLVYFVDAYTGERVSEVFEYLDPIEPENGMIYLYQFDDDGEIEKNALYSINGEVIIPYTSNKIGSWGYIGGFFTYNITSEYATIESDGKYGIFDIKNKTTLIEPTYERILQMDSRGYFVVKKNNKYGMVDANNTVMFGFDYQRIHISGNYIALGWDNMVQLLDFSWNIRSDVYCQHPNEKIGNCKTPNVFAALDVNEPFLLLATDEEPRCTYPEYMVTSVWVGYPDCGGFSVYDKNGYNAFHSTENGGATSWEYKGYYVIDDSIYDLYGKKILSSVEQFYFEVSVVSHKNQNNELALYNLDAKKDVVKTTGEFIEVTKNYIIVKEEEKLKIYNGNGKYFGYVKGNSLKTLGNDIFVLTNNGNQQIVQIHLSDNNWGKEVSIVEINGPLSTKEKVQEKPKVEEVEKPVDTVVDPIEEKEITTVSSDYTGILVLLLIVVCSGGYAFYKTGYYEKLINKIKISVKKQSEK